jgi:two-component system, sensor histidine kinase YesM
VLQMLRRYIWDKIFYGMRFKGQLLVSFLSLELLIGILLAISFRSIARETILNQNERTLNYVVRQISHNVDSKLKHFIELSNLPYSDKNFIKELNSDNRKTEAEVYTYIQNYLSALLWSNRSSLEQIVIHSRDKSMYKDGNITFWMEDALKEGFLEPLRYVSDNFLWKETWKDDRGQKVFSVFSRLPISDADKESLLEVRVYETELYGLIHEESREREIFIINNSGIIMSGSNRDIIGSHISHLPENLINLLEVNNDYSHIKMGNKEYVIACHRTNYGWNIVAATELTRLIKELNKVDRYIVIYCIIIIILAFLLTILLSNKFNRRMNLLNEKIQNIRRGEFDKELIIYGNDEFSMLSSAMDDTQADLKKLIKQIEYTGEQKRAAEMSALRSQINMHFLFNTLSSIKWLAVSHGAEDIKKSIDVLSSFLRIALTRGGDFISVRQEVEHLQAYAYLQNMRYGREINIDIRIPEELLNIKTVRLVLQPIVENALYHGMKEDGSTLNVSVSIYTKEQKLFFDVLDNGRGIPEKRLEEVRAGKVISINGGYGISNVNQRIKLCCGEEYGVAIESTETKGTLVRIVQPVT